MANLFVRIPFTIASGASKSQVIDLGSETSVLGIIIHGTWTAAKISFEAYVPDSGRNEPGGINPATKNWEGGAWDSTAAFDPVVDTAGVQFQWGNGVATSGQFITEPANNAIIAVRYIKVVSGTTASPVAQGQVVNGYIILRAQF